MASLSASGLVLQGRYQIPVGFWDDMCREYQNILEGSDIQVGSDLSGSTQFDYSLDSESPAQSSSMSRLSQIQIGVKTISAQALKHDDEIEQWIISSNAKTRRFGLGIKRHTTGFKTDTDVEKFADKFKAGGGTPLIETLGDAMEAYVAKVKKNPDTSALTLVWFLDGVDDSMYEAVQRHAAVDLTPLKQVVMTAAAEIKRLTGCNDVREKLGVQFCLVTSNRQIINAYNDFDATAIYTDPKSGDSFECDIFDCTTLKQIENMGGWTSDLTSMKLIGGPRSQTFDNMFDYLEEYALDYDPNSSANPPSYEEYSRDLDTKRKARS